MRAALALFLMAGAGHAQGAPDFSAVGALFAERCVMCHSGEDAPLGLHLDTYEGALKGSENGPVAIAGDQNSPLLQRLRGQAISVNEVTGFIAGAATFQLALAVQPGGHPNECSGVWASRGRGTIGGGAGRARHAWSSTTTRSVGAAQ